MTKLKLENESEVENKDNEKNQTSSINHDLINSFNKLINNLIASYNKYNQIDEQIILDYQNDNFYEDSNSSDLDLKKTRSVLFDKFMQLFDDLLLNILNTKRDSFYLFVHLFQISNLAIIKFYEFINKLLNVQIKSGSNSKCQSLLLHKSIQVLHVLTTNQSKENEDDESTIMCCEQLAHSFNFTGSLCSLLMSNLVNTYDHSDNVVKKLKHALLSESDCNLAFDVLNKLTRDNKIFSIDVNVKQFINYLVEKIADKDYQNYHIQFISNIVTNNSGDIENTFKSNDRFKQFCRQLVSIIKENANLTMNCLVILIKLGFENIFNILWPLSSKSTHNARILDPIDNALFALSYHFTDSKSSSSMHGHFQFKFNALNFLYEFVKCEIVRNTLENNSDYSNIFLFKLNQLLVENDIVSNIACFYDSNKSNTNQLSKKLPSSFSIKILKIFNELATKSEILANKLFQIAFNTQNFIEKNNSKNQNELTKKLRDLILTSSLSSSTKTKSSKSNPDVYDSFIRYYLKLGKIVQVNKPTDNSNQLDDRSKINNFSFLSITFFQYLFNLFKKNENNKQAFELESQMIQVHQILIENLDFLYSCLDLDQNRNFLMLDNTDLSNEDSLWSHLNYYSLGLIDSIAKTYPKTLQINIDKKLVVKLNSMLKEYCWLPNQMDTSLNDQSSEMNAGNSLIVIRLIIRHLSIQDNDLKFGIFNIFKQDNFVQLLSIITNDFIRNDMNKIAYEILFELNQAYKHLVDVGYSFPMETFISFNEKIKLSKDEKNKNLTAKVIPAIQQNTSVKSIPSNYFAGIDVSNRKTTNNSEMDKLFDFYDYKLKEQNNQIGHLINTLNQYYSNSLLNETECKNLREQLRTYVTNDVKMQKELDQRDEKYLQLDAKLKELIDTNAKLNDQIEAKDQDLNAKSEQLSNMDRKLADMVNKSNEKEKENKKLLGDVKELQVKIEEQEKSHEETLENLQRTLSTEINHKKDFQNKYNKVCEKLQSAEAKEKELESKLEQQKVEFDEKYSTLKNEHNKLKSILSYVKENYN